ncbi:sigma-54-dependent Fis family transcriptional regulator [Rhodococcus opacus]|uniref:sigma-54-dependent Fis family transcriptional regulator n=1 Tax=Rhodococcus opacus TaxID=37919 RepID=UPI002235C3CF|nr:helix-turn-helix domain-containing protein [Rhodococcus opacus]UZG59916.1 Fis family transcriptional regulator [Rhodococcus opacus]
MQLRQVAGEIVEHRRAALSQSSCSLAMTDSSGRLLRRWVEDRGFASILDSQCIAPDYTWGEAAVGTNSSGIVLETGRSATVAGPEHFSEELLDFTCAGAPIRHPITRRLVGTLNVTVRFRDTSPILQTWVTDLALEIERALLNVASRREQVLMSAYLAENRDIRHPVICLDDQTVISNAAAARRFSSVDQALLWEHASTVLHSSAPHDSTVSLGDGTPAVVKVSKVFDGTRPVGAVLRVMPDSTCAASLLPKGYGAEPIRGLVGTSDAWRKLCHEAAELGQRPKLLVGDAGVGKFAVASALAGSRAVVVEAESLSNESFEHWLDNVRRMVSGGAPKLILRRLDRVNDDEAHALIRLLDEFTRNGIQVDATMRQVSPHEDRSPIAEWFDVVLEVPSLSQRIQDLPLILDALTMRHLPAARSVRWLPNAVQTLSRIHWNRNVASIDAVVREILARHRHPTISAADLPPRLRAEAGRRDLAGLEHVEAKAILDALQKARGNKRIAADDLGIARSTLYRKVRALGIDLSSSNY